MAKFSTNSLILGVAKLFIPSNAASVAKLSRFSIDTRIAFELVLLNIIVICYYLYSSGKNFLLNGKDLQYRLDII